MKADPTDDDGFVLHAPGEVGSYIPHLTPESQTCDLTGLRVTALPPGRVEVDLRDVPAMLNVVPQASVRDGYRYVLDGVEIGDRCFGTKGNGYDLFAGGQRHVIAAHNPSWELLVEFDEDRLPDLAAETWDGVLRLDRSLISRADPIAVQLAALTIAHLRQGAPDRLYVQGLAIALSARALSDGKVDAVSVAGTHPRIARAIDYIEAHLGEDLSVAAIASAAAMSPSWLQSAFKAATGQPVFAYVRERRLERARILLADRRLSLSQIAYACGFSSHSHMTRLFTARYGMSPREMR